MSMGLLDAGTGSRLFRAPAPKPLAAPLPTLQLLRALRRNPIGTWTDLHYEKLVLSGESILGKIVVISDPALIKHVLVDNAANYNKGLLQSRVLASGLGNGLLLAEGETWRMQRRAMASLFTPRTTQGFHGAMADVAADLSTRWGERRDGRTVDLAKQMARTTLKVLARTIFSEGLERRTEDFANAVTRYLEAVGKLDPLDVLDMPRWIPRIGRIKARSSLTFFDEIVTGMVEKRRRLLEAGEAPRDLLTLLLQARDPETGQGLSEDDVKANVVTFLAAGHETTSNALTWAFYLVSQDSGVRARLEDEVDRELAEGRVKPDGVQRLVYTRAVIDEALRLYPPAATLTRDAEGPDTLGDLYIKAGGRVVISPWVLHRHKRLWTNPDSFDPERFMPENKARIDRFGYLPFGAGPRVCIGSSFALSEAVIILASVIRHFRLEYAGREPPMPTQRISLRPQGGMPMTVTRR